MKILFGFRNVFLAVCYMAVCAWIVYLVSPEGVSESASPIGQMGIGVAGIAAARAVGKFATKSE